MTDDIMEQAQVFASAWALVGGRFDNGDMMETAESEKAELRRMIERAVEAGASSAAQDAKDAARYRWIRDGSEWEMFEDRWLTKYDIYGGGPNDMDAAIDEAVEAQQRGSGT